MLLRTYIPAHSYFKTITPRLLLVIMYTLSRLTERETLQSQFGVIMRRNLRDVNFGMHVNVENHTCLMTQILKSITSSIFVVDG